jgi:hypothetical protein
VTQPEKGARLLPIAFEALEPFVADWAIESLSGRDHSRGRSSAAERKAFYAATIELLEPALNYLDSKSLASLADADMRLMRLMLSLAHVALAEEVQCEDEPTHAHFRSFLPITVESV